jgi:hypothetical protein
MDKRQCSLLAIWCSAGTQGRERAVLCCCRCMFAPPGSSLIFCVSPEVASSFPRPLKCGKLVSHQCLTQPSMLCQHFTIAAAAEHVPAPKELMLLLTWHSTDSKVRQLCRRDGLETMRLLGAGCREKKIFAFSAKVRCKPGCDFQNAFI